MAHIPHFFLLYNFIFFGFCNHFSPRIWAYIRTLIYIIYRHQFPIAINCYIRILIVFWPRKLSQFSYILIKLRLYSLKTSNLNKQLFIFISRRIYSLYNPLVPLFNSYKPGPFLTSNFKTTYYILPELIRFYLILIITTIDQLLLLITNNSLT
jgi:hypothetical protein